LLAKGRLIHRTQSMAFTETSMYDAQGQLCAQATGTFKYVPKRQPTLNVSTD
jgi:YD repeat-containing protein